MKLPMIDLSSRSREELDHMYNAAQIVTEAMRVLQKSKTSIIREITETVDPRDDVKHYPKKPVYDGESFCEYYYVKNAKQLNEQDLQNTEHGNFHTFFRGRALKNAGVSPVPLPDFNPEMDIMDIKSHLVGIGMSHYGTPARLFTVNRWVTRDVWYKAEDLIKMLNNFEVDMAHPSWPVNLWVTHMMILFRPQIETLLLQRDKKIVQWQQKYNSENIFKDEKLRAISYVNIDLDSQIKAIEQALR